MVTHATHSGRADQGVAFWLGRLKEGHAALTLAIEDLAQLTAGPCPDRQVLINARWAVSQASLTRRLLWGRIHTFLARRVGESFERDLRQLQEKDVELIRSSAKHVGRWTADSIAEDWEGYCRASKLMRAQMLDAIAGERHLLYPILESLMADTSGDPRAE